MPAYPDIRSVFEREIDAADWFVMLAGTAREREAAEAENERRIDESIGVKVND